jgi:RNA polymerase sigma-70 factor (ECF subfamily)
MPDTPANAKISALLDELRGGNAQAQIELVALIYPQLREIAQHYLRSERVGHTLQPTALVHETYARLFGSQRTDWKNRAHFFAAVATEMRRILVDYARARNAQKRPGKRAAISLSEIVNLPTGPDQDLVVLDEALSRLAGVDARAARVVELRFFTGLNEQEAAEALGISISTLKRDWDYARAWLFSELR